MATLSDIHHIDVKAHDITVKTHTSETREHLTVTIGPYPGVVLQLAGATRAEKIDELTAIADTLAHAADRIANEVTA